MDTLNVLAAIASATGVITAIWTLVSSLNRQSSSRKNLLAITRSNGRLVEVINVDEIDKEEEKLDRVLSEIRETKQTAQSG